MVNFTLCLCITSFWSKYNQNDSFLQSIVKMDYIHDNVDLRSKMDYLPKSLFGPHCHIYCPFIFKLTLKQERIPVGCVPSAAVAISWGVVSVQEGGVCPGAMSARGCLPDTPPPWTEWQTGVKTLPCHNYVAEGNESFWSKINISYTIWFGL